MPRCILCLSERELTERPILPFGEGSLTHKLICEECNKVIDRTIDEPFLTSIFPLLPSGNHKLQSTRSAASSSSHRFGAERQLTFNFDEQNNRTTEQINANQNLANDITLEVIKVAYELAALEFGDMYVMASPTAAKLRKAISEARCDEISFRPSVDLGPLSSVLSRQDALCFLLFQNTCIVSILGRASSVEYCLESELYVRSIDNAVLYVTNPVERSYTRYSLSDYLVTQGDA